MPFREDLILKEFSENREKKEISEDDIRKFRRRNVLKLIVNSYFENNDRFNDLIDLFEIEYKLGLFGVSNENFHMEVLEILEDYEKKNLEKLNSLDLEEKLEIIENIVESLIQQREKQKFRNEFLEDYRMYLENIRLRLGFKFLREDDERIIDYEKVLKKEIVRLKYYNFLWKRYPEEKIKRVFREEYKITKNDIFHPLFWIKIDNWFSIWTNYKKQQEILTQILRKIMIWYSPKERVKYKVLFLKTFRQLDRFDEDYNFYNSYPILRREIWNILLDLEIDNKNYQKLVNRLNLLMDDSNFIEKFRKILQIKDKNIFIEKFWEFLEENKLFLWEEKLRDLWEKIFKLYQEKEKIKDSILKEVEEEFILKLKVALEDIGDKTLRKRLLSEFFKWDRLSPEYKKKLNFLKEKIISNFEDIFIKVLLEEIRYTVIIEFFKKEDNIVLLKEVDEGLYELFEDVFTGYTDEQYNKVNELTYQFLYNLIAMYIWGMAAIFVRSLIVEWLFWWAEILTTDLYTLYKTDKILGLSSIPYRTKLLITEWIVFDWVSQIILNAEKAEKIGDIVDKYNFQSTIRTVLFLWILRWLNWIKVKSLDDDKIITRLTKEWIDISLDMAKLIWVDITLKVYFDKEVLPKDKEELLRLLQKEIYDILPFLIWLRIAESKIWGWYYIQRKVKLFFRSKWIYLQEGNNIYLTEEIRKQIKERGIDEYIIRWRLRKNEREETKRSQRENVPTEIWKPVEKFIEETTLYEVMTWYKGDFEVKGIFKEIVEKMERGEIDIEEAIFRWKWAIRDVVWNEAYKRFNVLNNREVNAIRDRIKLLEDVWKELMKAISKMKIIEFYNKIERYRKKEVIWKTFEQIEFVEGYFMKMKWYINDIRKYKRKRR